MLRDTSIGIFCFLLLSTVANGQTNEEHKVSVERAAGKFEHPEGLHWNHRAQKLFFVDIDQQNICRFDSANDDVTCAYIANGPVGFVIPVEDIPFRFVVGSGRDFLLVVWNDKNNNTSPSITKLATVDDDHSENRWNDGKADSHGRFWGGTIGPEKNERVIPDQAGFYRIDTDLKPKKEISPVTNSNGLAWNLQDDTLYYIDTPTRQIAAFDFNPLEGTISNKRIVFNFEQHGIEGLPDGMTIDTDGNLWVAMYNGGSVHKVNPKSGEHLSTIKIPATKVTTVAFGGSLLDILYVATSGRGMSEEEKQREPDAGSIFAVKNLGARGLLSNEFHMLYGTNPPS